MNILISGSDYRQHAGPLAIGFSLIFGVARIVNIAHTAFYMVAAYGIYHLSIKLGLNPVLSTLIAVLLVTVLGLLAYTFLIDPIREHEGAVLIATIALAMIFQEIVFLIFTGDNLSVNSLIDGFFELGGVKILYQQVLTFGVVLPIAVCPGFYLMKTRLGLAIRSTAEDREVANLMGMNESRLAMDHPRHLGGPGRSDRSSHWPPVRPAPPHVDGAPDFDDGRGGAGPIVIFKGKFKMGPYILGFTEALVIFLIPTGAFLKGSIALSIMIIVLLIRPEGLFGISFEEER